MVLWKKTQSTKTYEKWEARKDKGFGKEVFGEITLIKMSGYPRISYGILAKCYTTKQIGIDKESRGLVKVHKDRTMTVSTYKLAKQKVNKFKKEISSIMNKI